MNLKEFRAQYPQYDDLSDQDLAAGLHKKFYSDIPFNDFLSRVNAPGEEEPSGFLRQVADVPVGIAKGVTSGVRMLSDVFGANNPVSQALQGAEGYLNSLMSAQARNDQREIARIMKEAEDKGVLDQVIAGVKAFATAPVDLLSQAAGTAIPVIAGGLAGTMAKVAPRVISGGIGAGMGTGVVKGTIYEETKQALLDIGVPEDQAEARANLAQSYGGQNLDQILMGTALGGLTAVTGFERPIAGAIARRILGKEVAEEVGETAGRSMIGRAAATGTTEAIPEFLQASQEQIAANIAQQREGLDVPTMRGAVSAGTMEGLAGFGLGAGAGAVTGRRPKEEAAPSDSALNQLDAGEVEGVGVPRTAPQEPLFTEEPEQVTPVSDDENSRKIKELRQQIALTKGEIRKLEEAGTDETTMADWYSALENLQAQDRALRRGETAPSEVLRAAPKEAQVLSLIDRLEEKSDKDLEAGILEDETIRGRAALTKEINTEIKNALDLAKQALVEDPRSVGFFEQDKSFAEEFVAGVNYLYEGLEKGTLPNAIRSLENLRQQANELKATFEQRIADQKEYERRGKPDLKLVPPAEPSEILRAPGAREEALRMAGMTDEQIQSRKEQFGEPGVKYKPNAYEQTLTTEQLMSAGLSNTQAKGIVDQLAKDKLVGPSRGILNNILQGKFKFPDGWRVPTEQDYADANDVTKAKYDQVKAIKDNAPQQRLLAQQMGLDLTPAEEGVSREFVSPIAMSEREFELTAPEGRAPAEVEIETEAAPDAVPLNLVKRDTKRLKEMLGSLQPSVQAEQGVKNYQAAVTNFLDEVDQYLADASPEQRKENIGLINEFFNRLGLTSNPDLAKNLVDDLKGKTAEQQAQILAQRTRMPNLTSPTGLSELRAQFQDFMEQQNVARLGEFPGSVATRTFAKDAYIPAQVANILRQLRSRSEKSLDAQERAFMAYMSKFRYGLAMRSAAYDLANGVPMGDMFSGQGAKSAELFQKFIEENFPAQTFTAFNETIAEYKRAEQKAARAAEIINTRQKQRKDYLKQLEQERAEVAAEMRRQSQMEAKRIKAESLAGRETERMEDLRKTFFNANTPAGNFKSLHPAIEQRLVDGDLDGALELIEQFPGAKYWKLLAKRLRALNLDTTTQFDSQERLMRLDLAKIAPTVEKLIGDIQAANPSIYSFTIGPAINEAGEINIRAFAKGLREFNSFVYDKDPSINTLQLDYVLDRYDSAVKALDAPGFYMLDDDVINLNTSDGGNSFYTLFHELLHAATAHAIRNPDKLDTAQKQALDNLKELYEFTVKNHPNVSEYGLLSLDEFISEAFSNAEFQGILSRLPYKTAESSIWSKFIHYVRRLLGGKDTVLFGTLANADVLMTASQTRPLSANKYSGTLRGPANKVKRTSDGSFRTAPDMSLNRRWLNSVTERPTWDKAKGGVKNLLENVTDASRKHLLGAFTLRQLQDLIGTRLGLAAKNFILSVEGMLEEHNKIVNQSKKITEKWTEYQSKNPKENDVLGELMIDATLVGVDPDVQVNKDSDLTRRWDSLSEAGKAIYRDVRNFYNERMEAYKATLLNNIRLSLIASGTPDAEIRQKLASIEAEFNKNLVGPYFPLRRFGQYWINIGKGPDKGFYMFDSAAERNAATRLFQQQGNQEIDAGNSLRDANLRNLQDVTTLDAINKIIDGATDSVLSNTYTNYKQAGAGKVDTLRDIIKDGVQELYLLTLPNQSLRRNFIHRKGVSGASKDMLRAFADTSSHMAYQHARFKFSRQMFDQLNAASEVQRSNVKEGKGNTKVDSDYLNELYRRLDYVMNPTDTGTLPTVLSNVSFLWYLTAPASAVVNMLGVPAFGFPVLSARFGKTKAAAMLSSTAKQFMTAGFKDADGKFAMPSISMTKLNDTERRAYDIFTASGLIDITQAYDLAGLAESPSNMYTGKMSTVMRWGSFMFHHAERFNREVMAMSTFKLAYKAAKDAGFNDTAAFNKAIDQAKDLTYRSMFDYSSLNKPRYLQNAYAKVILQFKQFPQQMTYLLARSTFEWFSKDNPELREEVRRSLEVERAEYGLPAPNTPEELEAQIDAEVDRIVKEGRDRLLGTLGMTFAFAGATGLPLFSVGAAVIEALYSVFSDDDEPPLDFENWFKNWMATTFGDFWGDAVSRGIVTQATGMNFADRMSLNDMWFRDPRASTDEVTAFQNMVFNLLGPTASLGISAAEALKLYNDGHYYRGLEKLLPTVLRQPMVGARYATEGALTLKGDELVAGDEINAKDALSQSIGFSPEKVAQRQKANIETKRREQEIISKRQDLMNAFFMGVDGSDDDLVDRSLDKIQRFNSMYPTYPITGESLTRSIRSRYKARAMAEITGGIPINKNLLGALEDMGYYGTVQ
jgi:hypothetical protein